MMIINIYTYIYIIYIKIKPKMNNYLKKIKKKKDDESNRRILFFVLLFRCLKQFFFSLSYIKSKVIEFKKQKF
jgi:hypothetical protein